MFYSARIYKKSNHKIKTPNEIRKIILMMTH